MYVYEQQEMPLFIAPNGRPWPRGTAIALLPFPQHSGFIDYTRDGRQIMVHKSKQHGAIATWAFDFNPKGYAYRVVRIPATEQEADEWLSFAYAAVERGDLWDGLDNCQDLISQAVEGRKGSPTRDGLVGVALVAGALWYFGNN
jgi:hypothetical protein